MRNCKECGFDFESDETFESHDCDEMKKLKAKTPKKEKTERLRDRTLPQKKFNRKKRVPLGTPHLKLNAEEIPGKKTRWIKDKPGRLDRALAGGWEFVRSDLEIGEGAEPTNTDIGSAISTISGQANGGRLYLMAIDEDMYEEDQATKQAHLDSIDNTIRRGKLQNQLGDKSYTPEGGITYERR